MSATDYADILAELDHARRRLADADRESAHWRRAAMRAQEEADHWRRIVEARSEFDETLASLREGRA